MNFIGLFGVWQGFKGLDLHSVLACVIEMLLQNWCFFQQSTAPWANQHSTTFCNHFMSFFFSFRSPIYPRGKKSIPPPLWAHGLFQDVFASSQRCPSPPWTGGEGGFTLGTPGWVGANVSTLQPGCIAASCSLEPLGCNRWRGTSWEDLYIYYIYIIYV